MRASGYARANNDWYIEPAWIVKSLLKVESLDTVTPILDPACGSGNIPKVCKEFGLEAYGSDLVDRGYGSTIDFFSMSGPIPYSIVSNPPYGILEEFISHALSITKNKVCILARLAFLEGMKRQKFFLSTPLARVWVSSRRVSMPPGGRPDIKATGGTIAYAWFVWERDYSLVPHLGWL